MIGVCLLALVSCTAGAITKPPPTTGETTPATTITINPRLRKALLEALNNYDGDESTEADDETTTASSATEGFDETTDQPSFIKIHTFAIDGDKSDENEVIKTIIITRPRTTLTPPKDTTNRIDDDQDQVQINFSKVPDPVNEDSDKTDNVQLVRSVESRKLVNEDEKKTEKPKKKASVKAVTKPITPRTTTTTLPPPVTNADGENIEKVAKEDVKILQAPLLAAFTVQQDINGQPKNVISLFKNPSQSNVNDMRIINMEFRPSQQIQVSPQTTSPPVSTVQDATVNSNQQLLTAFENKQRELEQHIRFLQARQRDQDEIIRRQQLQQEQQNRQNQILEQNRQNQFQEQNRQNILQEQRNRFEEEQRQRQRFDEEQRQRQRQQQEQQFLLRQQQAQAVQQPQNQALQAPPSSSPNVQFIPSIPVGHTVGISVEQQLPFKGPVEFNPDQPDLQKTFAQLQQQFQFRQFQNEQQRNAAFGQQQLLVAQPLIQKHEVHSLTPVSSLPTNLELPVRQAQNFGQSAQNFVQFSQLPTNLELPQKSFQTFNSAPLSILPSLVDIAPQTQARTRVFRNDASQTGNFGFSDVQIQQQHIDPINYSIDNQLQNLFLREGITTRSAEDFGIISKILALNHGVPNNLYHQNRAIQRFQ